MHINYPVEKASYNQPQAHIVKSSPLPPPWDHLPGASLVTLTFCLSWLSFTKLCPAPGNKISVRLSWYTTSRLSVTWKKR